jgi:hypothetical protein
MMNFAVWALLAAAQSSPPNEDLDAWSAAAVAADSRALALSWRETTGLHDDVGSIGPVEIHYDFRWSTEEPPGDVLEVWDTVPAWYDAAVPVAGIPAYTGAEGEQRLTLPGLEPGTTYYVSWCLELTDADGWTYTTDAYIAGATTSVDAIPPAAVADFRARLPAFDWTAPGDNGSSGRARIYDLRWSTADPAGFASAAAWFAAATPLAVEAPATAGTPQSATIPGLPPATRVFAALRTADEIPNWSALSDIACASAAGEAPEPPGDAPGRRSCSARGGAGLAALLAVAAVLRIR